VRLVLQHAKEWEKCLKELPQFPSFRGDTWAVVPSPRPFLNHDQWTKVRDLGKQLLGAHPVHHRCGLAGKLKEIRDHVLEVGNLSVDARNLGQPIRLVRQALAQEACVKLKPAQRIAHLVRDARQHHLHAFVARQQCHPHVVEARSQQANLIAGLDRDLALEIALTDALGRAGQPLEGPSHSARQPCGQRRDDAHAQQATPQQPSVAPSHVMALLRNLLPLRAAA